MIEILTKILAKITIIVVENREPSLFINVKKSHYPYSLIRCWPQLLTPMSGLITIKSMLLDQFFNLNVEGRDSQIHFLREVLLNWNFVCGSCI